ncbi:MAG: hypothetical protein V4719_06705 [Planctomycetota bacterium]
MRKWSQWMAAFGFIGLGYALGVSGISGSVAVWAQNDAKDAAPVAPPVGASSEEAQKKITAAFEALKTAREALETESLYVSATKNLNAFGVLSGGFNAVEDLESGRGVDPETFAALYSDLATEEVKLKLSKDDKGRLVYNGKLIQMYPISRLRKTFDARNALSGEKPAAATGAPAKEKAEPEEKKEEKAEKSE